MNNKVNKKILSSVGVGLLGAVALSNVANAQSPFAATDLGTGYMVADAHKGKEGKASEAKCGADAKMKDGKCGEGKCGEGKMKDGKCGAAEKDAAKDAKMKDGKCGEGKCGKK